MRLFLPDTHAIYWYEFGSSRLSPPAEGIFKEAQDGSAHLISHPIVLAEFYWLLKKGGMESNFFDYLRFLRTSTVYRYEPITAADIERLGDFVAIPEMHDRLIAITAARLGATVITLDASIRQSGTVNCLW